MRRHGWLELAFTEEYIIRLFTVAGCLARRIDCEPSIHGTGHIFTPRGDTLQVSELWFPDDGGWSKGNVRLLLDATDNFRSLVIDAQNHHPASRWVEF